MPTTKLVRVYTGDDGCSHFQDLELRMGEFRLGTLFSYKSGLVPVNGVVFRENPLDGSDDFHNPPRRQFVITLTGAVELKVSDGSTRVFGPGDVLFAEDTRGAGHSARELLGPRRSLILPVGDEFDLRLFL
ncbi:MAG TPA: hypothetical protein VNT02_01105 [Burkholderiales bacterium]|nr:hypothetical protein [Burkholderiales bacterium]